MLKGKKILVTRPEHQAEELCELITGQGGTAISLPTIKIIPPDDEKRLRKLLSCISNYAIGIFISQNAVDRTLHYLDKESHVLEQMELFAIGKSTARALRNAGFIPKFALQSNSGTEELLDLPELQANRIKGVRIVIFRGHGGRELLADILEERGASVDYAEVYQRVPVNYTRDDVAAIWKGKGPDYIVITSESSLQFLLDMLSSNQRQQLLTIPVVVFGERLADLLPDYGVTGQAICVGEMTNKGILDSIMQHAGTVNQ